MRSVPEGMGARAKTPRPAVGVWRIVRRAVFMSAVIVSRRVLGIYELILIYTRNMPGGHEGSKCWYGFHLCLSACLIDLVNTFGFEVVKKESSLGHIRQSFCESYLECVWITACLWRIFLLLCRLRTACNTQYIDISNIISTGIQQAPPVCIQYI